MKKILVLAGLAAVLAFACKKDDANNDNNTPRTEVPDEMVGAWEAGYIDFDLWEAYPERRWAGRNSLPSREAMVLQKNGNAKFYRYEQLFPFYEELIDCAGTVAFNNDGTFTFYPAKGRKRYFDFTNASNSKDRALTKEELQSAKLAGKRGWEFDGSSAPQRVRITVPTSAPYYWYKK